MNQMRQLIIDGASVALFAVVIIFGLCSTVWRVVKWFRGLRERE